MLLIANHVLGDVARWWNGTGRYLKDGPNLDEVFVFLRQVAAEAESVWSALPEQPDGYRTYTVSGGLVPISIKLEEYDDHLFVVDIRFPPSS